MKEWRRSAGAVAVLLALTVGFYWKLTLARERTWLAGPDSTNVVRPWLDFEAREFHAGRFPLWDPYEWAGHTLIGQVQPGITNPLNWLLFAMPLDAGGHIPVSTLHWYWVLIHWLGAVACYALCRDQGAGQVASVAGGAAFALMGFMGHTDWPQILMTSVWVPVVLLFFLRVVRGERPRASAALGGAALGMAFLSGHHVVPTFTAVLIGTMWAVWVAGAWRRRAANAVVFFAVWLMVSAVQVLPAIEYAKQSVRWADAPEPLTWGEPVPYDVHARYSLGLSTLPGIVLPGISKDVSPHVGFAVLLLALVGARRRWWIAGFAAGGLLLALGKDFPLYWLIYRFVPMVEKAREPSFAIVLFQFGVAVLAAIGIGAVRWRWAGVAAVMVILAEAVNNAPRLGPYEASAARDGEIARFLKSQPGWFRVEFDDADVPYNFGDFYGVEQFGGAVSSMPVRVHRMLGRAETPEVFGVRYRVARKSSGRWAEPVFRAANGITVWRDSRIGEPLRVFRERACGEGDVLRVIEREPERFAVQARLGCPGLVVAGDEWYPGWRVRVDGERRPVQELDAVRAVKVPAGMHRVEFVYRPARVYLGLGVTIAGLLITAFFAARAEPGRRVVSNESALIA